MFGFPPYVVGLACSNCGVEKCKDKQCSKYKCKTITMSKYSHIISLHSLLRCTHFVWNLNLGFLLELWFPTTVKIHPNKVN